MRTFILECPGINWIWYANASLDETGEFIYVWDEFRRHRDGDTHPEAVGVYNRYEAKIDGTELPIIFN
jgi:hypothetical protein